MPVFTRTREGVLEVVVDGDYTYAEIERAWARAETSGAAGGAGGGPVLLDMSGAAGLDGRPAEEHAEIARLIVGGTARRLAVVGAPTAAAVVERTAAGLGVQARPFDRRSEAVAWLNGSS